ncbi:MAG: O-antigen ligase family protein [Candidatus Moranbacteria bacterium]|nr:O-antigen ligase family protein [Candidatus Moranbacteria bacterium]
MLEVLALLCVTLSLLNGKNLWEKISQISGNFLMASGLLAIGTLFSILFNDQWRLGFGILKGWFFIPMFFSFCLYAVIDSPAYARKIFQSLYFSTVAVGTISLVYKIAGIVTYDDRLSGFYASPNYLAMYLAPGIFFGFYFLYESYQKNKFSKKSFAHIIALGILSTSLYFTYSYGTWMATLAAMAIVLTYNLKTKKYLFFSLMLLILATTILFFSQVGTQKFADILHFSQRSSIASRVMIWKASFLLIKNNPIFGIGPGNFQQSYLAVQPSFPPYLEWAVPQPHNLFLAFWLQTGFVGLLGFLWILFFVFKSLFHIFKNKKDAALAAPLLGFFLYTMLHGLIDTPYWKNDLAFLFWICVFLVLFLYNSSQPKNSSAQ